MSKLKLLINLLFGFLVTIILSNIVKNQFIFYIFLILSLIYIRRNKLIKNNNLHKTNNVFFSLIVAAKNESNNIEKSVNYLKNINYDKNMFEVIIVNDNSTDDTLSILQNINLPDNFKILNRQRNDGFVAGVLNDGISIISNKSQVIGIIDADTIPSKCILTTISKYYNSGFKGCIQPQEWHYNFNDSIITIAQHFLCIFENFSNLSNNNFKVGHFIHRDIFKSVKYDEMSILEDVTMSNKLKKKNVDIIQINDVLVYRTFHNNIKSIYSQQYRYQLGLLINSYKNKIFLDEIFISLIILYNVLLFPFNGFYIFLKINLILLFIIYNLISNGINNFYIKTISSALKNYPEDLDNNISYYKDNYILEILSSTIFAYLILTLRTIPFIKIPLGNERIVWNRFKN